MDLQISKTQLIDTLVDNCRKHAEFVAEAKRNYIEAVKRELQAQLDLIAAGKAPNLRKVAELIEPVSYESQYQDAITMLNLDNRSEIRLSQAEFTQYVLDRWTWGRNFATLASNYTSSETAELMSNKYGVNNERY